MKTSPRHLEQQLAWRSLIMVALPALIVLPLLAIFKRPCHAEALAKAGPLFTMASEPPAPCHAETLAAAEPAPVPPSPQLEPMVLSPIPAWQEFNSPIRGIETPPLCDSDLTVTNLPEPPNAAKLPRGEAATSSQIVPSTSYIVHSPLPPYPSAMRKRRITGSVGVRISVSPQGLPTAVDITRPSGHSEFDTSTRSWILRHWRFQPAATAAVFTTTIHFKLN